MCKFFFFATITDLLSSGHYPIFVLLLLGYLINGDNVMLILGQLHSFLLSFSFKNYSNYTKEIIIAICLSFTTGD